MKRLSRKIPDGAKIDKLRRWLESRWRKLRRLLGEMDQLERQLKRLLKKQDDAE